MTGGEVVWSQSKTFSTYSKNSESHWRFKHESNGIIGLSRDGVSVNFC